MPTAEQPRARPHLANLLGPIRGRLLVAAALQVLSSALVLAPLIGIGELARRLLAEPVDVEGAWTVVTVSSVSLAAGFMLRGVSDLLTHLADNTFALHLRRTLAARMSSAPLGWFTDRASGRIKQGLQDDVASLHFLISHSFTDLASAVTTPVVVFGYLFTVDWRLATIMVLPVLVFVVMYRRMMVGSEQNMTEYGRHLGDVNNAVSEFVSGIPVVKTFGQVGRSHRAYRESVERFSLFFLGWARPMIRPESISRPVLSPVSMVLLALGAGTGLVASGTMAAVDLVPFVLLGVGVAAPVTTLASGARNLQMADGAAARVTALLEIPRDGEPEDPQVPAGSRVEFERVSFSYDGGHDVLSGVDARIEPGTITALVGVSGSGKSTLARLLLGFAPPGSGSIRLGGVALDQIASSELYRRVGFVFQDVTLLRVSMAENIALGRPQATREEVEAAARAANVHDRITTLPRGYDSVHGEDASLSGGEAQRVGLARALLLDPPLLVLDEPTSATDAESERAVQNALSTLVGADPRRSVIVIAHRLETVTGVDTILVLHDGRVVERGSHDELVASGGRYASLWDAQRSSARAEAP